MEEPRNRFAAMLSGLDIHYDLDKGHPHASAMETLLRLSQGPFRRRHLSACLILESARRFPCHSVCRRNGAILPIFARRCSLRQGIARGEPPRAQRDLALRTWTKSSGTDDYAWCGRRISRPVTCKLKLRFGINFRDLLAPCANGATISNLIDGKCTSTLVKSVNGPATALNSEVYAYG
jgi:hypothetical protein